ncbi:hypothetical protein B0H13DRAFT_2261938, partial [Mycena leptocephala]
MPAARYNESSTAPIQRGPKACTNCRRRKIKCDAARPICNQCRLRPPRSKEPCQYPRPDAQNPPEGSPSEMLETINALRNRIEELEYLVVPDPTRIYLNEPYTSRSQGSHTPDIPDMGGLHLTPGSSSPIDMLEPPSDIIAGLVDVFLERFTNSGYFFLDPARFQHSALLPLPFGHRNRPSPALLSAVYLWGCVLSHVTPSDPYTPDAFLHWWKSQFVLETIQAEVLLSFYYLHAACPVQGRYHASVAASISMGANLHLVCSPHHHAPYPPFTLESTLPPPRNAAEEADAFWAVVVINSFWVGAEGSPSPIPYGITIDSPWPSSSHGGATITKFLNGNDEYGSSAVALLTKASILLERIIAFSARTVGVWSLPDRATRPHVPCVPRPPPPHLPGGAPALPGAQTLVLTHALVDLAIVRLHAPYTRTSDAARGKCLAAAARVVGGVSAVSILDGARNTDPMLGPIYAGVASVYIDEIIALTHGGRSPRTQAHARELETRLGSLMGAMASLAAYSPLIEHCFVAMRPRTPVCLCRDSDMWMCMTW